jgi:hypothetical protein
VCPALHLLDETDNADGTAGSTSIVRRAGWQCRSGLRYGDGMSCVSAFAARGAPISKLYVAPGRAAVCARLAAAHWFRTVCVSGPRRPCGLGAGKWRLRICYACDGALRAPLCTRRVRWFCGMELLLKGGKPRRAETEDDEWVSWHAF